MPTFDVNVSPFSIPSSIESTPHQLTFVGICPSQNYFTSNPLVSELFYPTIRATLGQWIKSLIFSLYSVHFGDYTQRSLRSSTFNMVSEHFTHHPLHPLFLCLLTTYFVWNLVTKQAFIIVNKLKSLVRFCLFVVFNKDQRMRIQEWRSTAHPNYASKKKKLGTRCPLVSAHASFYMRVFRFVWQLNEDKSSNTPATSRSWQPFDFPWDGDTWERPNVAPLTRRSDQLLWKRRQQPMLNSAPNLQWM